MVDDWLIGGKRNRFCEREKVRIRRDVIEDRWESDVEMLRIEYKPANWERNRTKSLSNQPQQTSLQ